MREIYLTFALWTSGISIGMWVLAALMALRRRDASMTLIGRRSHSALQRLALQPGAAARVERLDLRPLEARHVGFHLVADPGLQVGQVAIAFGKALQQLGVELQLAAGSTGSMRSFS